MMMHTRSAGSGYATVRLRKSLLSLSGGIGLIAIYVHPAPAELRLGAKRENSSGSKLGGFGVRGITPQVGLVRIFNRDTHEMQCFSS